MKRALKRIVVFIRDYWKYGLLPVYLLLALIARRKTEQLIVLLPDIKLFGISLYPAAFRTVLILLGALGLLTVIYAIRSRFS